jgi:hypothetical protein
LKEEEEKEKRIIYTAQYFQKITNINIPLFPNANPSDSIMLMLIKLLGFESAPNALTISREVRRGGRIKRSLSQLSSPAVELFDELYIVISAYNQ